MIYVNRYREENGEVIKPSDDWFDKASQLTQTAIAEGKDHEVTDHYKHAEVKMALEKLFYDKCAYCECSPVPGGPWDVEHYRPKGRVAERVDDHPGYYWLAYDWTNLFPACTFCNQRRKDQPRYDNPITLPAQGKLDQFPIENEDHRAMSPAHDLGKEQPYLLNPCDENDKPEDHFSYDITGEILPSDEHDTRAKETIRICHLTRYRLRAARARLIIRMSKAMRSLRRAREAGDALAEEMMKEVIDDFVAPYALYAGVARAVQKDPDAFIVAPP